MPSSQSKDGDEENPVGRQVLHEPQDLALPSYHLCMSKERHIQQQKSRDEEKRVKSPKEL